MAVKFRTKVVSVAINNEFIKICELTKNNKNISVQKVVTVVTPDKSYSDGIIYNQAAISNTIKTAIEENGITENTIVFTVASTKIATKEVLIPNVKANKVGEIIHTNATEYFPVNIEEYIIQHTPLEQIEEDGIVKLKVLVIAAPSEIAEGYYNLAQLLGMKVERIDYIGNSIYQVLRLQIENVPSVVIQIENDSTIVNIFNKNVLQLQRTIPYGKSALVNAVMDEYGLKYEEALSKLQNEELLHTTFDGETITESLRYMVSNINRVVDYHITRNTNKPIEKAYVIGNATTIKGMITLLEHELNLPLNVIDTLKGVTTDKKSYINEVDLTSYIGNIGAYIHPVNFVPTNLGENEKSRDSSRNGKMILAIAVLIAFFLIMIPFIMMISSKMSRDYAKADADRISDIETIVNEYYAAKDIASDASSFQKLTENNNDNLEKFVAVLEEKMSSDISISSMSSASGSVTIMGTASSKSSIALLLQQLSRTEGVDSVRVGSETEAKDNSNVTTITFSLTCGFGEIATDAGASATIK